jgi:hypothetical protein
MMGSNSDRSAFKARSLKPHKAISVYAHHDDLRSFAQLAIRTPDQRKGLTSDRTHAPRTNQPGAPNWCPLSSLIFFTRVTPCTKSNGLMTNTPYTFYYFYHVHHRVQKARGSRPTLHTISVTFSSITFSTRITTYNKQGAPQVCTPYLVFD